MIMSRRIDKANATLAPLGMVIREGAYAGTCDDVAGTYYVDDIDSTIWDRRGRGFSSPEAALEQVEDDIAFEKWALSKG